MNTNEQIQIERCSKSRINEVDFNKLGFGNYTTDHMFIADYTGQDWEKACIVPYQHLNLAPTTLALHYGQTVFEGMKAFRMVNGKISVFRIKAHHERLNASMPEIPFGLFERALLELIRTESNWLKDIDGMSLYIRPFVFASEERYGVKVSETYKFIIFLGAVGEYYSKNLKVKIEETYTRASKGGTGTAKCGGNYGGAFYPTYLAQKQGFDQVIWTTGAPGYEIEESGTMNIMFVADNTLITPSLSGSILNGITRDSLIKIAKHLQIKVYEKPLTAFELKKMFEEHRINEAFGTGTAAVTAPIESIQIFGNNFMLPETSGNIRMKLHNTLYDLRKGKIEDIFGWNSII